MTKLLRNLTVTVIIVTSRARNELSLTSRHKRPEIVFGGHKRKEPLISWSHKADVCVQQLSHV